VNLLKRIVQQFKLNKKEKKAKSSFFNVYLFEIILAFIVICAISLMFPRGKSYQFSGLKEGEIYVGDKIIAPFTFAINKSEEEYNKDIKKAREEILPVFVKDDSVCEVQHFKLNVFFHNAEKIVDENVDNPLIINLLNEFFNQYDISSDENIIKFFVIKEFDANNKSTGSKKNVMSFSETLQRLVRDICGIGILNKDKSEIASKDNKISVLIGNEEITEDVSYFNDQEDVKSIAIEKLRSAFNGDESKINFGYRIITEFLSPNIFFDTDETKFRMDEATSNVPRAKGTVLENEKIIDTYEKITTDHIAKLNSLAIEKAEREAGHSIFLTIIRYLGKFLMVCLGMSILIIFLIFNRWRLLRSQKKVILVAVVILLVAFLSFIINKFTQSSYLIPITIASMLLTIFFDTRLGFVGTIALSIIIGGMRGNEFIVTIASIIAGTVAILSVAKVRSRTWFFKSILLITGAYLISITTV